MAAYTCYASRLACYVSLPTGLPLSTSSPTSPWSFFNKEARVILLILRFKSCLSFAQIHQWLLISYRGKAKVLKGTAWSGLPYLSSRSGHIAHVICAPSFALAVPSLT